MYASLFNHVVSVTGNGEKPTPVTEFPPEKQHELAWMFFAHGIDMETGGELVHKRTGIRLVLDRTTNRAIVWAWTSVTNSE